MAADPFAQKTPAPREVHLWRARFADWVGDCGFFSTCLSQDEKQRWTRYKIADKRQVFLISRGLLRIVLSRYLHLPPEGIQIAVTPGGKPHLPGTDLHFSIAHTGDDWIAAITISEVCGVDIESEFPSMNPDIFTKKVFHPAEQHYLDGIGQESVYHQELLSIWTAKEAYLKARGLGIREYPNWFSALPDPLQPGSFLLDDPRLPNTNRGWTIRRLEGGETYQGAVAVNTQALFIKTERIDRAGLTGLDLNSSYHAAAGSMPD